MPILAERGYLIPAINNDSTDYVKCAVLLAESIKHWNSNANITLLTNHDCGNTVFDQTIVLPFGDQSTGQNKQCNDWQVFRASPYRQTIKLEADMLVTSSIEHWWTLFEHRDVVISTGCRDFYGKPSGSRFYRQLIDTNNLPDVYNAITYWRMSQTANDFFLLVRRIFENWNDFKKLIKFADEEASTDVVYALAAQIIGVEQVTLPFTSYPQIVHMKKHIIPITGTDWTQELVWEYNNSNLKINTIAQHGAFHYNVKEWTPNG